jgi:hypothetical protein
MQLSGDAALADALATGQVRDFGVQLLVDWDGDGSFDNPYSDLSSVVTEAGVDRQITGDLPEEVTLTEGYSSGELKLTLEGIYDPIGQPVHEMFDPYNLTSPFFGIPAHGQQIRYSILVPTSTGTTTIRQFTGRIRSLKPQRRDAQVSIVASDNYQIIGTPVTLPLWAADGFGFRNPTLTTSGNPINASWVIDHALRRAGYYQGPELHAFCAAYWTCHGALLPERGGIHNSNHSGSAPNRVRSDGDPWMQGQYGLATSASPSANFDMEGNCTASLVIDPTATSGGDDAYIGMGAWVYVDPVIGTGQGQDSIFSIYLDDYINATNASDVPAQQILVVSGTGRCTVIVQSSDLVKEWRWEFQVPTAGWHYVGFVIGYDTASVTPHSFLDGVYGTPTVPSGFTNATGGFPALTHPISGGQDGTNKVLIWPKGPTQHFSVFRFQAAATTGYNAHPWPIDPPTLEGGRPMCVVDRALNDLLTIPDTANVDAWTIVTDVAKAEMGVVHVDEYGTVHFLNHATLRANSAVVRDIDYDDLNDFSVEDINDRRRNAVSIPVQPSYTWRDSIWASPSADAFDTAPLTGVENILYLENAQAIDNGQPPLIALIGGQPPPAEAIYGGAYGVDTIFYTAISNWTVACYGDPSQRIALLARINNNGSSTVRFAYPGGTQQALFIGGYKIIQEPVQQILVATAIPANQPWLRNTLELPGNAWRTHAASATTLANYLLTDLAEGIPLCDTVPMVGDPRLQLRDRVRVTDPTGQARIYAEIVGTSRTLTVGEGLTEVLTLRLTNAPGKWVLGDPVLSILGDTTIL